MEKGWERKGRHLKFQEGWTSVVGVRYQASNQLQRETDKVESKEVKQSYLHFLSGLKRGITTSCKNPAKKMKERPSAICQRDRKSTPMESSNASKQKGILGKGCFSLSRNLKRT